MRETLRFQANVPYEVALAFDEGKVVEGQFGDQFYYRLAETVPWKDMYVQPIVEQRIRALGIRREQPFVICKAEVKNGTRKGIEWKVELKPNGNGSGPAPATSLAAGSERRPESGTPQAPLVESPQHQPNTATPACAPPEQLSLMAALMLTSLSAAIDVVSMAEQYALTKGHTVRFCNEDVRAVAITLYIGAGGRR